MGDNEALCIPQADDEGPEACEENSKEQATMAKLSPELFSAFVHCKRKASLLTTDDSEPPPKFEELKNSLAESHSRESVDRLTADSFPMDCSTEQPLDVILSSKSAVSTGVKYERDSWNWTFDAIERRPGKGGGVELRPIRFANASISLSHARLVAAADAILLGRWSGTIISRATILRAGNPSRRVSVNSSTQQTALGRTVQEMLDAFVSFFQNGVATPEVALNRHCDICRFTGQCRQSAIAADDISLLRGLTGADRVALQRRRIRTIGQLACTFQPARLARQVNVTKHSWPLQAAAIRDGVVYVTKRPRLPAAGTSIYLDVEGVPTDRQYYLVGALVEKEGSLSFNQFWSDSREAEQFMWLRLLDLLRQHIGSPILHYGRYEADFASEMCRRYGAAESMKAFDSMTDLYELVRGHVYFPAYSNRLKDIMSPESAQPPEAIGNGAQSIYWRLGWEATKDLATKEELLAYNRRDCYKLRELMERLRRIEVGDAVTCTSVEDADTLRVTKSYRFGSKHFAMPEFAQVTRAAYFNYQRDKVLVRTSPRLKLALRRRKREEMRQLVVNRRIECGAPLACPRCGRNRLTSYTSQLQSKTVKDIRFSAAGAKRWVTRFETRRYQCMSCRHTCYSPEYPTGEFRFGRGLSCWVVHQHVALRQPFEAISDNLADVFSCRLSDSSVSRLRKQLAEEYASTELAIADRLRSGKLICADEAKIQVRGGTGYVWVFSNEEEVLYRYSRSRDGTVLDEIVRGFDGVLVSDFYSAYDSVSCRQQKCIIHLIRDINDDLLRSPFDEALGGLGQRFATLMQTLVRTVDKRGLKSRYLRRFKATATAFLDWVASQVFDSIPCRGFQKRFARYGQRLFTFLEHDGVPWNNNLAENAVKVVASRRRVFGSSFSESGMGEYLRFLSIYQTLRRKGASFLRFLLDGRRDLFAFVGESCAPKA